VGIVDPGKGGKENGDLAIFNLVEEARTHIEIDCSLIFVAPYGVLDAALEAMGAGIPHLIIVTAGVPPLDMMRLLHQAQISNTVVQGSGSAGIVIPDRLLVGTYDPQLFKPGRVAIVSRSYSTIAEVSNELNQANLGESIAIHLGSDRLLGNASFHWLEWLQTDPETESIVLIGDIWWDTEAAMFEYFSVPRHKSIIAYLAGLDAHIPALRNPEIVLSHALSKPIYDIEILQQHLQLYNRCNIPVANKFSQIVDLALASS
jgi:succinyl-CoA synthetase alpha subunit